MRAIIAGCLASLGILLMGPGPAPAGEAPEAFVIGAARVTALRDMPGEMPLGIFRGADMRTMQTLVPSGSAPAGVTVFLVQLDGRNIVIDTGFGANAPERKSALPELLRNVGVGLDDIDAVLLTHLHGDHVGGLVMNGVGVFPKAAVMVSGKELAFWTAPETVRDKPGLDANARQVKEMRKVYGDRVKTFAFNDIVASGITALGAVGHTPGHSMFLLESDGGRMLFWGDIVHAAALQFANPAICATYDMDMPGAVAARRDVFAKAAKEKIPVAGAHLPYPAVGRVVKRDGGGEYAFAEGL